MKASVVFLLLLLGLPSMAEEVSPSESQKKQKEQLPTKSGDYGFVDSRHWLKPRPGHESPDSIALEAQTSGQRCEKVGDLTQAENIYQHAIETYRSTNILYDQKLARDTAKRYAKLLRRLNRTEEANHIEREFCDDSSQRK
jgi:hypothetical protein